VGLKTEPDFPKFGLMNCSIKQTQAKQKQHKSKFKYITKKICWKNQEKLLLDSQVHSHNF
jgi:hypothetical protein